MATMKLTVPKFGVSTDSVGIVEWLKQIGDEIRAGEPVVMVETDKAMLEIEATTDGILVSRLAEEGDNLDVGEPYAEIEPPDMKTTPDASGAAAADAPDQRPTEPQTSPEPTLEELIPQTERPTLQGGLSERQSEPVSGLPLVPSVPNKRGVLATPSARALARANAVDLTDVQGSAPGGRVRRVDVYEHIGVRAPVGAAGAEKWSLALAVPLALVGGNRTALADVAVVAAAIVLGRAWPNWQAIRVRDDDVDGLVVERCDARGEGNPSELTWRVATPAEIQQPGYDVAFVVSEVAGLAPTLPVTSGVATLAVDGPIGGASHAEMRITFDPERFSPREAYAALSDLSRFVASPHELIGALWDRTRS